jgi:hypothetical protein
MTRPTPPPPTISAHDLTAWLLTHVEWLAASEHADEISRNVDEVWAEARRLVQPDRARRIELRRGHERLRCAEPVLSDTGEVSPCPGVVVAYLRDADSLLPAAIVCSLDPEHRWGSDEWERRFGAKRRERNLRRMVRKSARLRDATRESA